MKVLVTGGSGFLGSHIIEQLRQQGHEARSMARSPQPELEELERQVRDELFRLRMKHYSGQLQRPSDLREKRRDIARIKTVLTEKRG